jgi:ABC-type transporter Mla subunit MlaD
MEASMSAAHKVTWLLVAVAAICALVIVWIVATPEPFRLVILFDEAGALKKGDPVVWKEFNVGKVERIEPLVDNRVGVTIRIKDEYSAKITRGTEFVLKRSALLGFVGKSGIEVVTPDSPGLPFANLEHIPGKVPERTSVIAQARERTVEYWRQLKEQTGAAIEEFKSSPEGREVLEVLGELQALAVEGARQARDSLGEDHQKQVDALVQKLERIRDEMRKRGQEEPAERIDQEIGRIRR